MDINLILAALKERGYRSTKTRQALIKALSKANSPLSALELQELLMKAGLKPHKTTVYRELESLQSEDFINAIKLGGNSFKYELKSPEHCHHLVCTKCRKIDRIAISHNLGHEEKAIKKAKNFKVTSHVLEFYGLCSHCYKE